MNWGYNMAEVSDQYKETKIGVIPKEWDVKQLGELGEFKNGINKSEGNYGFGTLFVNISDVYTNNTINTNLLDRLNATENEKKHIV